MRRSPLRGEDGQIVPLMLALMILLLVGGMVVFWIGASTSQAAGAQTAADASALAAEQSAVTQFASDPMATIQTIQGTACQQAANYAASNHARVLSCQPTAAPSSIIGYDFIIEVEENVSLPSGSPDAGGAAKATARASTDPFSQASPTVKAAVSSSCDASTVPGPVFTAHPNAGSYGFFPTTGANYSYGCERKLAGALEALGQAKKLHLQGTSGYVAETQANSSNPAAVAHGCGDASSTPGLESVPESVLKQYGLVRPFRSQPDLVELAAVSCDQQATTVDAASGGPIGFGDTNVHLVPLSGGPVGQLSFGAGGGISIGQSPLQVGCQIYRVWRSLNISPGLLRVALIVAQDESAMGQNVGYNRTDPNQSVGVFQQISNDGWGTLSEEWDVSTAAAMFLRGAHDASGSSTEGLISVAAANPGAAPWQLAQDTQHSGAGQSSDGAANYGASSNMMAAQSMFAQVMGGGCKGA